MTDYIHHTDGTIDRAAGPLPKAWGNTSGLDNADAATLESLGWLPVVDSGTASAFTVSSGADIGDPASGSSVTRSHVVKSLADCKVIKKDQLAVKRYDVEVSGITVGGVRVNTDRETQSILTGARILAKEDAGYSVNWKTSSGWAALNAATIIAVADAVAAHVQGAFDTEKAHSDAIDALTTAAEVVAYNIEANW